MTAVLAASGAFVFRRSRPASPSSGSWLLSLPKASVLTVGIFTNGTPSLVGTA